MIKQKAVIEGALTGYYFTRDLHADLLGKKRRYRRSLNDFLQKAAVFKATDCGESACPFFTPSALAEKKS